MPKQKVKRGRGASGSRTSAGSGDGSATGGDDDNRHGVKAGSIVVYDVTKLMPFSKVNNY